MKNQEITGIHIVKYTSDGGIGHVYIDGEEIHGVRAFSLEHEVGCVPVAKIEKIAIDNEVECDALVEETYGRARINVRQGNKGLGVYVNGVYVEGVDSVGREGELVILRIKDPVMMCNGKEIEGWK